MLAAVNTSLPFMSDEAMAAALPGRPEYTVKKYLPLVEALRRKAEALSNAGKPAFVVLPCCHAGCQLCY